MYRDVDAPEDQRLHLPSTYWHSVDRMPDMDTVDRPGWARWTTQRLAPVSGDGAGDAGTGDHRGGSKRKARGMGWWRRKRTRAGSDGRHLAPGVSPGPGAAAGVARSHDGDRVPRPEGRRWVDYLSTDEWPVRMTPGQEHRAGARRWLP